MTVLGRHGLVRGGAVLAVDQGTTNTKAVLVDATTGAVRSEASAPTGIRYPAPGWVEQDADQIWASTLAAIDACLQQAPEAPVVGVGLSNQRESVVCWSRSSGRPLGPVIGWQDARTAAWCESLATSNPTAAHVVRARTGLTLDPMFSAPKFRAVIDAAVDGGAHRRDVAVGTVDAWLLYKLTGEYATEPGNASRTLLFDLQSLTWHDELLELFGVDRCHLPEIRPSDGGFGVTSGRYGRLRAGVPVVAVLADSHAALFQHGCTAPGTGKATYGTGSSVMSPTADLHSPPDGIATTVAWHIGGAPTFAREGNIVATGSALDWMAATLGAPAGTAGGAFLSELATGADDDGGVSFVPAFSGLGAPHWDRSATGLIAGVTGGTTPAHLARAALESVAHQVADVVDAMESDGVAHIEVLHADGGATASALLMQLQADLLQRPVEVSRSPAASALGVARLVAQRLGVTPPAPATGEHVHPRTGDPAPARQAWAGAVARSRGLTVPALPTSTEAQIERNT
jgi:glycerol kinase